MIPYSSFSWSQIFFLSFGPCSSQLHLWFKIDRAKFPTQSYESYKTFSTVTFLYCGTVQYVVSETCHIKKKKFLQHVASFFSCSIYYVPYCLYWAIRHVVLANSKHLSFNLSTKDLIRLMLCLLWQLCISFEFNYVYAIRRTSIETRSKLQIYWNCMI